MRGVCAAGIQRDRTSTRWRAELSPETIRDLVAHFSDEVIVGLKKAMKWVLYTISHREIPAAITPRQPSIMQSRICSILAELAEDGRLRDSMQDSEVRNLVRPIYLTKYGAEAIMPSTRTIGRAHQKCTVEN